MDAIFAILVLGAVIFFGALISAGNERQRKAIDGIREQAAQWAMQDLRLKREHLARDVKVDDPIAWLNRVVAKVMGEDLGLVLAEVYDNPRTLVCITKNGKKIIFTPLTPDQVSHKNAQMKNPISKLSRANLSFPIIDRMKSVKLSILNCGILFDLELTQAWNSLANGGETLDHLWMFFSN